jgi:hypothetical protein
MRSVRQCPERSKPVLTRQPFRCLWPVVLVGPGRPFCTDLKHRLGCAPSVAGVLSRGVSTPQPGYTRFLEPARVRRVASRHSLAFLQLAGLQPGTSFAVTQRSYRVTGRQCMCPRAAFVCRSGCRAFQPYRPAIRPLLHLKTDPCPLTRTLACPNGKGGGSPTLRVRQVTTPGYESRRRRRLTKRREVEWMVRPPSLPWLAPTAGSSPVSARVDRCPQAPSKAA